VKWNGISVLPEQAYNISVGLQVNFESREILNKSPNGARSKKLRGELLSQVPRPKLPRRLGGIRVHCAVHRVPRHWRNQRKVPNYVEYTFVSSGKGGGVEAEEALAEELVVLGVLLQQVDTTFGDAVLDLGLCVLGTSPHDAGPEVHAHLRNSLFQVRFRRYRRYWL